MSLIEFSLKRRVTVSMMAIALILFGAVAFTRLPVNLLPDLSYPTLTVETRLPGAAPGEIESLVSRPVEEAVGVVAGVQRVTSVSRPGLSQVTLEFGWGRDMDFASIDVREKLDVVRLPRESTKPIVLRFDPANDPILRLYLRGGTNLYQLRYVAEEVLKKDLESTDGVAAIKVNGGYEEEIQVRVDQGKLSLLGISIQEVSQRLERENINQAGGSLYEKEARYLVRSRNEFRNLDDIMKTTLVSREGRPVLMSDIAQVERGHKQREVISRFAGEEAVELALYKEGDANTVSVARAVRDRLERVGKELPAGVTVAVGADQSRFIEASIREVISNAALGGLIAIVVLLFFLKDLVSTLIIGVSIPVSIIATFFLMYQTGTTLNIMSLGGLALGVGMLVDNAIVVLEVIYKRRERGESAMQAALAGTKEVSRAVVAATLTTVVVFVPVVFVEGVAAQLFWDQAVTVSFSLIASLIVSLTLIPMMAVMVGNIQAAARVAQEAPPLAAGKLHVRILRTLFVGIPGFVLRWARIGVASLIGLTAWAVRPLTRLFDGSLAFLIATYPPALRWALRSRLTVVMLAFAAFGGSLLLIPMLGVDLVPAFSQGEFSYLIELPEGTPLEATDRFAADVQSVLEKDARVEQYSSIAGGAGLALARTGVEGENTARIQVRMKAGARRAEEELVAKVIRERLEREPRAQFKFERPSYFTFRTPIEVEIYSDSLAELQSAAGTVNQGLVGMPGFTDVKSSMEVGNPELQITFNRDQLVNLGLDLSQVAATVRNKVQGEVATRFQQGDREIDILVRTLEAGAASVADVNDIIVAQRNGVPIRLKSIAEVKLEQGPSEIRRIGQNRAAVVSANLSGRDMGSAAAAVREFMAATPLPVGAIAGLSGQEEELQRSLTSLMLALALAIFLVYMVMACEFESIIHPFVVMFTVPLGAIGMLLALAVTGNSINVVAIIGGLLLAGIVVNNAIVLIDAVNQRRAEGMAREEALLVGGMERMRPILMTSACTVLGLLPMALGLGEGAELQAPLAITVIGGLTIGTILTLFVIPVVYTLMDRKIFAAEPAVAEVAIPSRPEPGIAFPGAPELVP